MSEQFEPKIVAFFCNWCTYMAADSAGISRFKYADNIRVVRVMCSGRIDPQFVLEAFQKGADAVLIGGCHPCDCHYQDGNYKCLRRYHLVKRMLRDMGIEEDRFRLEWISAAEADKLKAVVNDMVAKVRALGPLRLEAAQEVAFCWLASCGGCEETVVDLDEKVLDVAGAIDIVMWPVAMDFKKADLENMPDGSIAAAFVNGAVRSTEQAEMAHLIRAKAQIVIAFGACAQLGGIPGLANVSDCEGIFSAVYKQAPSVVNPDGWVPLITYQDDERATSLPGLFDTVRTLPQVIAVDYTIPGCPPTPKLLADAVTALLEGKLPARGTVLAPDVALCDECPRKPTRPEKMTLAEFRRPHQVMIDPQKCMMAQGLVCMGPATRSACGARCIGGNMPCTGCFGPTSRVRNFGAKALSAVASIVASNEEKEVVEILRGIPDPLGTFNRYSLATTLRPRKTQQA